MAVGVAPEDVRSACQLQMNVQSGDRNSNQAAIEGSNHRAAKYQIFVCLTLELGLKSGITFEENQGLKCMRD